MPQLVAAAIAQSAVAAPVVAPAVIAPAATGLGAAAANTAALELAKQKAIEEGMRQMGTQAAQQATQQVGQQVGQQMAQRAVEQTTQQAAQQGLAQAGTKAAEQTGVEAMKQGIFSNPAGVPPTAGAPITPAGPAQPLPPAGSSPVSPTLPDGSFNQAYAEQLGQRNIDRLATEGFRVADPSQAQQLIAGEGAPNLIKDVAFNQGAVEKGLANAATDPTAATNAPKGFYKGLDITNVNKPFTHRGFDPTTGKMFETHSLSPDVVVREPSLTVPESVRNTFGTPQPKNALQQGFETGLQYVKDNPITTGLGLMTAGQYMNEPEEEDKDKYKNTVDMSEFQPSIPTQRPFTRSYEYQSYQAGGPVEDMSRMNSLGANTGFPMARLQTPAYAVSSATPMPVNALTPTADAPVNAYTGEQRFAEGGISAAERREYGLTTRGQRAARNLTKSYEEMEEERQKEAMKLMGERSDPGIVPRSRTQMLSSPFSAALAEHARLGKKAKVPVVEMPKTNLGDIDNYMDIPIEAAQGGIMRSFSNGGPSFMGTSGSSSTQERQGPKFMGASQSPTQAEIGGPAFMRQSGSGRVAAPAAPVMSAPQYNAPAQQAFYSPISYQDGSSYQMPAQQSDMSDFYNYMNQQLANYGDYGYAAGGGIMSGSHLGGYSDGGRLLRGPGDGVSDSIPAVIGKRQPARLADGEFVVPARIVSELGNGSTEAGARKLYAMMERVQATRKKSIGKKKVAVNSKADKHLPA